MAALFRRDRIMRRGNCVEWPPRAGQTRLTPAICKQKSGADRARACDDLTSVYELLGLGAVRKLGRPVSSGLGRLSGHAVDMAALATEVDTKRRVHALFSP